MSDTSLHQKLIEIQKKLKVPKDLYNNFGGFKYRNAEMILEQVKPLCHELGLTIVLSDSLTTVGETLVAIATATLSDGEKTITNQSFAVHALEKKGMDLAQISGATSSYARKYALGGLFGLDDGNDPDSHDPKKETRPKQAQPIRKPYSPPEITPREGKATPNQRTLLSKLLTEDGSPEKNEQIEWLETHVGLDQAAGLTKDQASKAIAQLMNMRGAE